MRVKMPQAYPFVIKLLKIHNLKEDIRKKLPKLIEPVEKTATDVALGWEQKYREAMLEFIPVIEDLAKANNELVVYEDKQGKIHMRNRLALCGEDVNNAYLSMMHFVEKEQYFLIRWFLPILEHIRAKEHIKANDAKHLKYFKMLIEWIEFDLKFFLALIQKLEKNGFLEFLKKLGREEIKKNRAIVIGNVVKLLETGEYKKAMYWVKHGLHHELIKKDTYVLLTQLINAFEDQDIAKIEELNKNGLFNIIFNEEQRAFFERYLIENYKTQRRNVKDDVLRYLQDRNWNELKDLLTSNRTLKMFSKEEIEFLVMLINSVLNAEPKTFEKSISDEKFSQIFDTADSAALRELFKIFERERIAREFEGMTHHLVRGKGGQKTSTALPPTPEPQHPPIEELRRQLHEDVRRVEDNIKPRGKGRFKFE